MNNRIPVTVFTGFLGAGKTTLISNLLHHHHDRNFVVLVNDFAAVSVDGKTLSRFETDHNVRIVSLSSPLIGYANDQELATTLSNVAASQDRPDHVIIETSGLAVPTAIGATLQSNAWASTFVIDATIVVVDTPILMHEGAAIDSGTNEMAAQEVFRRQLEAADVVVLNKIDALEHHELGEAETKLRSLAPNVRFVELAFHAELNPRVALGLKLNETVAVTQAHELASSRLHQHTDGHSHSGLEPHAHGLHTHTHIHEHDPGWISFALRCVEPQTEAVFASALQRLVELEPIVRLKGTMQLPGGAQVNVHGVRDKLRFAASDEPDAHGSELVFIGYHLNRERTVLLLNEFTGSVWR